MKRTSEGSAYSLLREETPADRNGRACLSRLDYGLTTGIVYIFPRSLHCISLDIPTRLLHPSSGVSVHQMIGNTASISAAIDTTLRFLLKGDSHAQNRARRRDDPSKSGGPRSFSPLYAGRARPRHGLQSGGHSMPDARLSRPHAVPSAPHSSGGRGGAR